MDQPAAGPPFQEMAMNKLAFAAAAAVVLATTATAVAHRGMSLQGPRLTGVALQFLASGRPDVTTVTLLSGETIELPRRAANWS
jgi:hypothetical protein